MKALENVSIEGSRYFKSHRRQRAPVSRIGECAICHEPRQLVQDHCHATGLCRDKICGSCNVRLGHIEKVKADTTALEAYLERWHFEHAHGGQTYPPKANVA